VIRTALQTVTVLFAVWAGGLGLFFTFGIFPKTPEGWLLALLLGPFFAIVATMVGEAAAAALKWLTRLDVLERRIENATREQKFSPVRVAFHLVVTAAIVGSLVAISAYLSGPSNGRSWFRENFEAR